MITQAGKRMRVMWISIHSRFLYVYFNPKHSKGKSSSRAIFTCPGRAMPVFKLDQKNWPYLAGRINFVRLYPGIAPGWVYYFRPTIAAFAITGTNPYY